MSITCIYRVETSIPESVIDIWDDCGSLPTSVSRDVQAKAIELAKHSFESGYDKLNGVEYASFHKANDARVYDLKLKQLLRSITPEMIEQHNSERYV